MNWTFSGTVRFAVFLVLCLMTGYIMALDNYTEDYLFYKTYMKLEEIPDEIPNQARGVYLFGNLLTEVRGAAFINLTSCLELSLSENIISEIHPRAFSGLYNLKNLTLERNELTNLKVEMWQGLIKLKRLDLGRNHISQIEFDCFASLKNIERLSLQENSLEEIKEEMFQGLISLTKLLLCCNNIDSVSFPRLGKLLFLDLSYNNLRNLGSDTFDGKLFSLKELDLGMNTLVTIEDGSFRNMSKLTFLHLGNNKLEKFIPDVFDPDDFPDGHPSYLELDLSYNPIECSQELCWMQEASEDGWLLWVTEIGLYHQRCFKDPDNMSRPFLFVNPGAGIHPSAVLNCTSNATNARATESTNGKGNTEKSRWERYGVYVGLGIMVVLIFVAVLITVHFGRKKGFCCRKFENDLELNPAYDQQPIYEEVGDPVRDSRVQRVFTALVGLLDRCKC